MKEDRFLRNLLFQCVECLLGCRRPYKGLSLLSERVERQGYLGESCNKSLIKVAKSMEGADILNTFRGRPIANS